MLGSKRNSLPKRHPHSSIISRKSTAECFLEKNEVLPPGVETPKALR